MSQTGPDDDAGKSSRRDMLAKFGVGAAMLVGAGPAGATEAPDRASEVGTVWWTELITRDVAKASKFYGSLLGWRSKTAAIDDPNRAPRQGEDSYTLFLAGNNEVAGAILVSESSPGKSQPVWITYFQVDDVDKAITRAQAAGGRLLSSPFNVENETRMALLLDPDGILVGIAAPLKKQAP